MRVLKLEWRGIAQILSCTAIGLLNIFLREGSPINVGIGLFLVFAAGAGAGSILIRHQYWRGV